MKRIRIILLCITAFSLLFLSSCVTLLEEITVRDNGSGTIRFAVGVDTAFYPQFLEALPEGYALENIFANLILDENVVNVRQETYESGGETWEAILMEVSDFTLLFESDRTVGPLTFSINQRDGEYTFEQTLDNTASTLRVPGINLLNLTGAGLTVRLSAPQITYTNGLQEAAGISVWEVSLEDLLQEGESFYQVADYMLEPYEGVFIPWQTFYPYVVIGFLVVGVLSILIVILVNTRRKEAGRDQIKFDI